MKSMVSEGLLTAKVSHYAYASPPPHTMPMPHHHLHTMSMPHHHPHTMPMPHYHPHTMPMPHYHPHTMPMPLLKHAEEFLEEVSDDLQRMEQDRNKMYW